MKKLKFLAFLMVGLLACFGLNSCGDDDDEDDLSESVSSIVGTWEANFYEWEFGNATEILEFKPDGTFNYTHECQDPDSPYEASGTYTVTGDLKEGGILTLKSDGNTIRHLIRLEGKKMILTNEDGESMTYTKK